MYYTVDRIEGNYAICENSKIGKMKDILISELPSEVKEGDIIKVEGGKYMIDFQKQKELKENIKNKIRNAWN